MRETARSEVLAIRGEIKYNCSNRIMRNGAVTSSAALTSHAKGTRDMATPDIISPISPASNSESFDPTPDFDHPTSYPVGIYPPLLRRFVEKSKSVCGNVSQVQYWNPFDVRMFAYDCDFYRKVYGAGLTDADANAMLTAVHVAFSEIERRDALVDSTRNGVAGFVYLLSSDVEYWKIGCSKNPENRLLTFGIQLPFRVQLVCKIYTLDMYDLERQLHERFADYRKNGEWFVLPPDAVDYIKGMAK